MTLLRQFSTSFLSMKGFKFVFDSQGARNLADVWGVGACNVVVGSLSKSGSQAA